MAIQVQWANAAETILQLDYTHEWTGADSEAAKAQAHALIAATAHEGEIDAMLTVDDRCVVPPDVIAHMRRCVQARHPRTRRIVLVCASPFLINLWYAVVTAYPDTAPVFLHAHTLDEAHALLRKTAPASAAG